MARIMAYANMTRFADVVNRCKGNVYLELPDQTRLNLKEDRSVLHLLRYMPAVQSAWRLNLTDQTDLPLVMRYMMDSAVS